MKKRVFARAVGTLDTFCSRVFAVTERFVFEDTKQREWFLCALWCVENPSVYRAWNDGLPSGLFDLKSFLRTSLLVRP